jgi:hypothetical protein
MGHTLTIVSDLIGTAASVDYDYPTFSQGTRLDSAVWHYNLSL